MERPVLLIGFYNKKALGVRYLERALKTAGYETVVVFFKDFNSVKPQPVTDKELDMLKELILNVNPGIIGMSVMASLYLETVYSVNDMLKSNFKIPLVWGGVFPTLFPERCLEYADYVVRGEGEEAFSELVHAIYSNKPVSSIPNLAYRKNEATYINDIRMLCENIDKYGYPEIGGSNKYFINSDTITRGDPQLKSVSYELTASRGCPFMCSYCSSINLKRVYKGKGVYVRFRSVNSVLSELKEAKSKIKGLKVIHFWDEIFSDDPEWIDQFSERYRKEIGLPFEIWGHPLKVNKPLISKLVEAGLYKVVMGIQSGSPRVRKEIFHRVESQDEIISASRVLRECKVPQVIYDFMLQHPFETEEDIKQTYELCTKLKSPFELQLHGLNFLPGTDIVDMAIDMNILSGEQLEKIMYSSIQEQYDMYWGYKNDSLMSNFWYALTFMTQFGVTQPLAVYFAKKSSSMRHVRLALKLYKRVQFLSRIRYYYKKGLIVIRALLIRKK